MKVVGLNPSTTLVQVVLVEGDADNFSVPYREEWNLTSAERFEDYAQIRTRITERLTNWRADAVVVADLEPFALKRGKAQMSWFKTAELRGVLAEASHAAGTATEYRTQKSVGEDLGDRTAKEYQSDDTFWNKHLGDGFLKKYRQVVLLALSRIRSE
jgi:hypothetical protein